jgi:hypothetical protein
MIRSGGPIIGKHPFQYVSQVHVLQYFFYDFTWYNHYDNNDHYSHSIVAGGLELIS